jgi:GT2 family glycosyltransferase
MEGKKLINTFLRINILKDLRKFFRAFEGRIMTPDSCSKPLADVAIIIINYNSSDYTISCVRSLEEMTSVGISYQVVVVDNNSRQDEQEKLSILNDCDNLKIVFSRSNLGYSGGHMFGLQFVRAKYFLFLNNDCVFLNDCLKALFDFCENHQEVGVCAPQTFSEDSKYENNFGYLPDFFSRLFGFGPARLWNSISKKRHFPSKKKEYEHPLQVDLVGGSAVFVRADAFCGLGGFDINYFLYMEEEDLGYRMAAAGFQVFIVPFARICHFGGKSSVDNLALKKEFYISYFYYFRKHHGSLITIFMQILMFFLLARKSLRNFDFLKIAFFVLAGADPGQSLRFDQKLKGTQ